MDKEDTISRSGSSESDEKQQPPRLFESIHAGFPSPAEDIPGTALDINTSQRSLATEPLPCASSTGSSLSKG